MSMSLHKATDLKSTDLDHLQTVTPTRPHPHSVLSENRSLPRAAQLCGEGAEAGRQENEICGGSGDFNQAEVNEKGPAFSQDG